MARQSLTGEHPSQIAVVNNPAAASNDPASGEMGHASACFDLDVIDLLRKYDRQGPRYTSYPPATEFREMDAQTYIARIEEHRQYADRVHAGVPEQERPLSLYIHIPFCASPCFYCGCNKIITKNRSAVREYLDHLHKEMALMRLQMNVYQRPVTQLHWGGGTPTFLDDAEMTELMHQTANYFNLSNDDNRDYSIEVDPRSVSVDRIDLLRGLGFNRISLGIQDFNPAVQKAINREQSYEMVKELTDYIRARSFRSLNFDLIYGLPLQTVETVQATLQQVVELSPDRISCYNYAHLPDRFAGQKAIRDEDLPRGEEKLRMLSTIIGTLTAAGYRYIGMDHFARADDPLAQAVEQGQQGSADELGEGSLCRNFQGYSVKKADDLIGLGVSSISEVQGVYGQNQVALDDYYRALDDNQLPVCKGLSMTEEDGLRQEIIQRLSCYRKLDITTFEQKYGIDFDTHFAEALPQLQQFETDGLVQWADRQLLITDRGSLLMRNICMVFDEYLSRPQDPGASRPRFSRVI